MDKLELASIRGALSRTLIGSAFVLLQVDPAVAATLPPAGVAGKVSFNVLDPAPIDVADFGTYALSSPIGKLRLDVGATPSPLVVANAQIAPFFFGRSSAELQYSVQVIGPTPTVKVQVAVAGGVAGSSSLGGTAGDPFHGFAMKSYWSLKDPASATVFEGGIVTPALQGSFSDAFNRVVELEMAVNDIYRVSLIADAGARSGSASAFIDPVFSLAPGVGDGYLFVLSEGIGNAPVPELAPFVLLASGLLVLAVASPRARVAMEPA